MLRSRDVLRYPRRAREKKTGEETTAVTGEESMWPNARFAIFARLPFSVTRAAANDGYYFRAVALRKRESEE